LKPGTMLGPYEILAQIGAAPDGKRVAALMPVEAPETHKAQNHIVFLENFFEELRRRAPVQGK
jgi:hypothetical protein